MSSSPLLDKLVEALCCLPGIGKKSAQRIAYHLLQHNRQGALDLGQALNEAVSHIGHCQQCRIFSEQTLCVFCQDSRRDETTLCVVESPSDVNAIEESDYKGLYFVLMGNLSPLDGIGPAELGLEKLQTLIKEKHFTEVIIATNTTMEGEATAYYISEMVRSHGVKASRIAHGVPMGGELEYIDSHTIRHALAGRKDI